MKTIRMLAAAAALTLSLAAADAARAATVMHDTQGNVVVDAAPGETNNMSVQAGNDGGTVVLLDSGGAPLQAWDDGCAQVMDSMVECGISGYVELWLDDGNDRASVDIFSPASRAVLMHGEAGDDQLSGAPGVTGLDGGPGNDKLTGGEGRDTLYGGDGNDELKGLGGRDELYGQAGDDIVSGDSHKAPAADIIDGGPGIDRIDQDWNDLSGALVTLTLGGGDDDGRPGEGDDVRGVEKVISFNPVGYAGTDGADHIEVVQVDRPSTLAGGAGDDFLKTSDGVDRIDGGAGADTIDGGYNDDTIIGGPGPDRIAGDHPTGSCGIYWCKLPAGNDTIEARDGEKDSITCGFGTDTVNADPIDTVAGDCETVNGRGGNGRGDDGKHGGGSGGLAVRATGTKLRAALAKGLRLRVTAPGPGKLRATAIAKRKQVAAGSRSAKSAGKTTVTLKFTARAKRSLRRAKRAKLKIAVRFTPRNGAATATTTKVTLTR
jgi:Ca2+-binding RTX toxin-like protein